MKNPLFKGVVVLLILIVFGCSSEPVSQSDAMTIEPTLNSSVADASRMEAGELMGPLFDLAVSPNNTILVADVSVGISTSQGELQFVLPGVSSIASIGNGVMWATRGGAGPNTEYSGQAIYRVGNGNTNQIANLFDFEFDNNPDGQEVDSNPYAVAATNAKEALVADAGANDLLRVDNKGNIDVVAVFPNEMVSTANAQSLVGCPEPISGFEFICDVPMMPAQAVPTSIAIGPDGYYYVGELKGFPAPAGASNIWRIAPDASGAMCGSSEDCVKFFNGGFTSIVDLVFGPDGNLYVAELDEQSWFAVEFLGTGMGGSIKMCDMETKQVTTIATGIPLLTAITFDKQGNLWATQNALIPGLAEVVQVSY
ncbi:ScyD/ScyE family protein [Mangrovimonas sp. YM274]|uniref:ScyD/ScyE family protein n=1 Tax=Mangrovimonas sp. YM274 TaxID=3070660 RepID=UPI0027DE0288|nr:ScyD/ScyE family protein [Mangrovimonas sp. YM274]WMI69677.1 ScyD/ScyE family protein [Mangrovimonas sp. YM274]